VITHSVVKSIPATEAAFSMVILVTITLQFILFKKSLDFKKRNVFILLVQSHETLHSSDQVFIAIIYH